MIYLDIVDEIEKQNVKNVVSEFNKKGMISEETEIDTKESTNKKIKKAKIVVCDDVPKKINKYKELNKKVIVFIKKRKTNKLIDELYLQRNIYAYTRKNELREIINFQLNLNKKLSTIKTIATILISTLLFVSFSNSFAIKKPKEKITDDLLEPETKVEIKPSKKELMKYENIVFFGDSITEYYDLNKYYEQVPVINSGTSGNTTNDLLGTMTEEVYVYNPTKVVLLIGINDMNKTQDDNAILENIKTITKNIKEKRPKAKLYVESIYPVDRDRYTILVQNNVDNNRIRRVNAEIEKMCIENDYVYINMFDELNDETTDKLIYEYSKDGLHLSEEGYKVVTEKLKTVLES